MQIHLICVGHRMPAWVNAGVQTYAKRMPRECSLKITAIAMIKRGKNQSTAAILDKEGQQLLALSHPQHRHIILDERGEAWTTAELSGHLKTWMQQGEHVDLFIGGPEGLAPNCQQKADNAWSLSALTLPHMLVRVIVVEQLYRAWSMLTHHPYHRP